MVRDNGHLAIRMDVPGIKPEEITVEAANGWLTVSGEHEETDEKTEESFVGRERRYGAFTRRLSLPEGVDPKKIKASTHDGVLEIVVPLPTPLRFCDEHVMRARLIYLGLALVACAPLTSPPTAAGSTPPAPAPGSTSTSRPRAISRRTTSGTSADSPLARRGLPAHAHGRAHRATPSPWRRTPAIDPAAASASR